MTKDKEIHNIDIELKNISKEINKFDHKTVLGKLFNKFLISNTNTTKGYNYKDTEGVINSKVKDKNKTYNMTFKAITGAMFGLTSANGIELFQPEIFAQNSKLWDIARETGISENKIGEAMLFFTKLKDSVTFSVSDLDLLYRKFEFINNIPQDMLHQGFMASGVIGVYGANQIMKYSKKRMFDEEKIAKYSDTIDTGESTEDLKTLKNKSILNNSTLDFSGNASSILGKTLLYLFEKTNKLINLPQKTLNNIGHFMLKEDKNNFERFISKAIELKFSGYELIGVPTENQMTKILDIRYNVIKNTQSRQDSESTVKSDMANIIENSYQNSLRRKVKLSLALAISNNQSTAEKLKIQKEAIESLRSKKIPFLQKNIEKSKLIKSMKSTEKEYKESIKIIKSISELHLIKSTQLDNNYEALSSVALLYLNKSNSITLTDFTKKEHNDIKHNISDFLEHIDKDLKIVVQQSTELQIQDFLINFEEEFNIKFKSNKSKAYFEKEVINAIKNTTEILSTQGLAIPVLNTFQNSLSLALDKSILSSLDFSEKSKIISAFTEISNTVTQNHSNQIIKNPMTFNELLEQEQEIMSNIRIKKGDLGLMAGAMSNNINKPLNFI